MSIQKITLLLVFSFSIHASISAQKSRWKKDFEGTYQDLVFKESIEDFDIDAAPEKWASEPVVILCQKMYVNYHFYRFLADSRIVSRKRILIQDKSGLEMYSQFYYQNPEELGITIIKPDGSKEDVNINEAIEVNADIPKYQKTKFGSKNYFKIAIPNLEVGDIIDYYAIYIDEHKNMLPILFTTISHNFPIVNQEYIFDVHEGYTFYHNSFNGAPALVMNKNKGLDHKGRSRDKYRRFTLKDTDRAPMIQERWDYEYLTEPTIKIMVTDKKGPLGNKDNITKTKLDLNTILPNLWKSVCEWCSTYKSIATNKWSTRHIKKLSGDEKVESIYNLLKYTFVYWNQSEENQDKIDEGYIYSFTHEVSDLRSDIFSKTFMSLLNKFDVEGEVVVVMPRHLGQTEDAITLAELEFGIYVPETGKYYWTPNNYSIAGEMNPNFYGTSGFRIPKKDIRKKMKKGRRYKAINIPESKASDNVIDSKIKLTFEDDNLLNFTKNSKYTGAAKTDYSPILMYNSLYAYEDVYSIKRKEDKEKMAVYNSKDGGDSEGGWRKERMLKKKEELQNEVAEIEERREKLLSSWIEDDYEVEEIISFDINAFGNESSDQALDVTMTFSSNDYLKKAGPNLILDIGRMITSQIQLTAEEIKERSKPVQLRVARTLLNEISFEIPAGMKAEGLENLKMEIDNEAGSFISTVHQDGQSVTINTSKIYKAQHLPADKWPLLVDMLEAAYKFSQSKIVIKKL